MSSHDGDVAATPAALVFQRMAGYYPVLAQEARRAQYLAMLTDYLDTLATPGAAHMRTLESLLRLAELTGDAGAPAVLLHEHQRALEQCQAPAATIRASQAQALQDMAQVMRVQTGNAAADGEARAQLDPVTALPTRAALHRKLQQLVSDARDSSQVVAVLCVEVHCTAAALDQPGHATREDVQRAVAALLRKVLRPRDELSHTGPLEFHAALPGLLSVGQAMLAANRIRDKLPEQLLIGSDEVSLSATIGIAGFPEDGDTPAALLHCARHAADEARTHSERFARYRGNDRIAGKEVASLEQALARAIGENALELYYQPQLDLASGRVRSVEALLRWQRDTGEGTKEWVNPGEIIEAANRLGLVRNLSKWILDSALRQVASWEAMGLDVSVGVNLWAKALLETHLDQLVGRALTSAYVAPERLVIEITEGEMIKDWARSRQVISDLRRLGVTIAMDDFGTGYSHYSWLRDLDVDEIKIDQLFVRDLLRGPKDEPIVRSVISLAHELALLVVAEGVEDQATQDALTRMGCDRIQGFWLSRPLSAEASTAFLLKHAGR